MQIWDRLNLSKETISVIKKQGFEKPTPIQASSVPILLKGRDAVIEAETGSGKTFAFLIPLMERYLKFKEAKEKGIMGIILAPTRELATQIFECTNLFHEDHKVEIALLVGGKKITSKYLDNLNKNIDILVATPGRLLSGCKHKKNFLSSVKMVIMDEADVLFEMGFGKDLHELMRILPPNRQTALFSATMTDAVNTHKEANLKEHVEIVAKSKENIRIPKTLTIHAFILKNQEKLSVLSRILSSDKRKKIVYFSTCLSVEYFSAFLNQTEEFKDLEILILHGKLTPGKRKAVYRNFTAKKNGVLFSTDLAARGLDFLDIDLVISFDAPKDPKSFLHRSGRTARTGRSGVSYLFLTPKEEAYITLMENRKIPIKKESVEFLELEGSNENLIEEITHYSQQDNHKISKKAFVSYIRFYIEHTLRFIFQVQEIDIPDLISLFGLKKAPNMPELRVKKPFKKPDVKKKEKK